MNFDKLVQNFKKKIFDCIPFVKTGIGKYLAIALIAVTILVFFAPLFQQTVGTAFIACIAAPYLILIWRKNDKENAIVPAVIISAAMILASLIYLIAGKASVAAYYLIAILCLYLCAKSEIFKFFDVITDTLNIYLVAGAICLAIVIISSIIAFLVSIAWWILCLIAFLLIAAFFFTVVLGTAAYTATDDQRQARKKYVRDQNKYRNHEYNKRATTNKNYAEIIDVDYIDVDEEDI